jgi:hypothetical protein
MDIDARVELEAFHRFLEDQLSNGGCSLSPEECLDLWRAQHPLDGQTWEDINAVKEALDDMEAGDSGEPFHQFSEEFRKKNRLPA